MTEPYRLHESRIEGRGVDPAGSFVVDVETVEGVTLIVPRGELDMASTDRLRQAVDGSAGSRGVVVDLAEVTFIDSSVLKELLRASGELSRYETRLVLAAVPPPVTRLLDLTRTAVLFTLAADREAALEQLR
jgi:anti-anti-sigma factor